MLIEKTVSVPIGADEAFSLISSLDYVARCIPGARVTEQDGDLYRGELSVKVGPITARYAGTAQLLELDPESRRLVMRASGKDQSNRGGADANFTVTVAPEAADVARLHIAADIRLRGLAAQFGRGAVDGIIDTLVDEFASTMAANSQQPASGAPAVAAGGASAGQSPGRAAAPAGDQPGEREHLDALALLRGMVGPHLPGLLVGLAFGAVIGRVLPRRDRRAGHDYVTHAELAGWLWSGDPRARS